ncbi:MAG: ABC transporter ATP-binding protein [Lachnospiraceae bacterium]|nr:ABC transporter ATP-binding protein [Lachnospiraceae bacterium]
MSTHITLGAIYFIVGLKAWAGAFGVGQVTQYIAAITALTSHITNLAYRWQDMRLNAVNLKYAFDFLDIKNNMYQGSLSTEKRSDRQYDIEFKDVSFKYPGTEKWALRHLNVKFKVGSRLAVVGENGSGKTTFIKLLCRLYDPQEGQIFLNGIDIKKYDYQDYVGVFSVVLQDYFLPAQPIGENVAGSKNYDRKKAEKCLIDAGFGERLKELPQGLDTYLYKEFETDGVQVSGGEAQKIAIARALYKNAPFIILDEPTAALDPIAEAEIYSQFDGIVGNKTAIYISHRLSSCRFCDEILVFEDGSIIQRGSHDSLVETDGRYKELWYAQAQYYKDEEKRRQMDKERAAAGI